MLVVGGLLSVELMMGYAKQSAAATGNGERLGISLALWTELSNRDGKLHVVRSNGFDPETDF